MNEKPIELPYSVFKEADERAEELAYRPSSNPENLPVIIVPHVIFEAAVKSSREKAYLPSRGLENK